MELRNKSQQRTSIDKKTIARAVMKKHQVKTESTSLLPIDTTEFQLITNDGKRDRLRKLTNFKNLVSKQLPKMPRVYITKTIFDHRHQSLIATKGDRIIGGCCFRGFSQEFAELVFMCVGNEYKGNGIGSKIMDHLKEILQKRKVSLLLTYADNFAIGFFKKQIFETVIETPQKQWYGYIKPYDGGTLMECQIDQNFMYTKFKQNIKQQIQCLKTKIKKCGRYNRVYTWKALQRIWTSKRTLPNSDKQEEDTRQDEHDILKRNSDEFILNLSCVPGALENGWSQYNQSKLQSQPDISLYLEQLYGIACLKKLSLSKTIIKLQQKREICPPIDYTTIEKKIISGFYLKQFQSLAKDLDMLIQFLKVQYEGKKGYEELEKKIESIVTLLRIRKLNIPELEDAFKDNRSKRDSKSSSKRRQ